MDSCTAILNPTQNSKKNPNNTNHSTLKPISKNEIVGTLQIPTKN